MVVNTPKADSSGEQNAGMASTRKWRIIAALVIMTIMFYLLYKQSQSSRTRRENQRAGASQGGPFSRLLGGIFDFNRSGDSDLVRDAGLGASAGGVVPRHAPSESPGMPDMGLEKETDDSLLQLVKDLKDAGFTLHGQTRCRWTKVQRDLFGDRDAEARKALESMYVECLTNEMCPNIRGYPTWVSGNRQFGGFQPPNKLRLMAKEMAQEEPRQMLQAAPEPLDANIPDAKHNEDIPKTLTPEMAKEMFHSMLKDMRANESNSVDAAVESNRSGAGVAIDPGVDKADCKDGVKKENLRGVSAYAPLNVPSMPGTAPMNLNLQHADYQNAQGNVPRTAFQNHEPMADVARQVITSFQNLSEHANRDPNAASYSQSRLPHASDITTGEAMADKRVPIQMQPGSGE
jgi:hypothetical protein